MIGLLLLCSSLCRAQFVFIDGCTRDGIGAWLERNNMPWLLSLYCPNIHPVYKNCDWRGHANRSYADLFGFPLTLDAEFKRLQLSKPQLIRFNYTQLWRPQFAALDCATLDHNPWKFALPHYGAFKHEFNDKMNLKVIALDESISHALRIVERDPCSVHVGIHYRAGDVFSGLDGRPNSRSMPLHFIKQSVDIIQAAFDESAICGIKTYMFTELSPTIAAAANVKLPTTTILANASDEFVHIALASKCDMLILGHSAFSWIFALTNPTAVILAYENGLHKYISSRTVVSDLVANKSIWLPALVDRCKRRCDI